MTEKAAKAKHTKLLIIGSGPAGYTAAVYAARAGLEPVIVAGMEPGGQMTTTTDVENYPGFENPVQGPWLMDQMKKQAENFGTEMINDTIVDVDFSGDVKKLTGTSGASYTADAVIIATGAQAKWLGTESEEKFKGYGVSACATCDGFFYKGKEVVIVGGGNTAVEEALFLTQFVEKVTLIHRGDEILRDFDDDVRHHVRVEMQERGVHFVLKHEVRSIERKGRVLRARLTDGATHDVDQVMFATGRRANSADMGLEAVGVALDEDGAIAVDEFSRTSVPSIYAIGDVSNRFHLTPVAIREGHAFADTVFGNTPWKLDRENIPTAVFSEPEIGAVGLTEAEARAGGREIDIYRTSFRSMKSAMSGRATTVLMKLVVERASDRVLGVHIVGEAATEMIQMVAIAVKMGARKSDLDATVALHPTAAEELVTLRAKA